MVSVFLEMANKRYGFKAFEDVENLAEENNKHVAWIKALIGKSCEDCIDLLDGKTHGEIESMLMRMPDFPDEIFFQKDQHGVKSYEVYAALAYEIFKVVLSKTEEIKVGPILPFDLYEIVSRLSLGKRFLVMAKTIYYGRKTPKKEKHVYMLEKEACEIIELFSPYVEKGKKFSGGEGRKGKSDAFGKLLCEVYCSLLKEYRRWPTAREVFDAFPEGEQGGITIQEKEYDEDSGSPLAIYWLCKGREKRTKFHSAFEDRVKKMKRKI
jgi:hypothetical protein